MSLPSWERGLKLIHYVNTIFLVKSLPSWERGLKSVELFHDLPKYGRSPRGSVD